MLDIGHFFQILNIITYFIISVCHEGFRCDKKRCIPMDWKCDGHFDCEDHTDEFGCAQCLGMYEY